MISSPIISSSVVREDFAFACAVGLSSRGSGNRDPELLETTAKGDPINCNPKSPAAMAFLVTSSRLPSSPPLRKLQEGRIRARCVRSSRPRQSLRLTIVVVTCLSISRLGYQDLN